MMTALLTLGFMMRNTSPVGWIPLLLIKVCRDGAFCPFLVAGIFVFLPLTFACIYIDSRFYQLNSPTQSFEWTLTSLNFYRINVHEGLSKYFGDHDLLVYLKNFLPEMLRASTPYAYFGLVQVFW